MKNNKNIDRLFQEKLKDFEVSPPDNVWKGIESNLKTSSPKTLLPLWLQIGSVAAVLALLTIGSIDYYSSEPKDINDDNSIVVDFDKENNPEINEDIINKDVLNSIENNDLITGVENDDNTLITNSEDENTSKINEEIINKSNLNSSENKTLISEITNRKSKNDVTNNNTTVSDKKLLSNEQINSKKIQEQSNQNTIANHESKKTINNLKESNSEITSNNNNPLKQNVVLSNNYKDNINNPYIAGTTDNKVAKNNLDSSTSSNIYKVAKNIATENFDENLSIQNDKSLTSQVNSIKTENIVSQSEEEKTKSLENVLKENIEGEEEVVEVVEVDNKKWSVASVFAPIAYNSFNAKGSPLDLQFENSPKQGSKTMSYGVKLAYKINKKLSLQSGVALVNVGYEIGDVFINPSQQGLQRLTNVNYSSSANLLNVQAGDILNNLQLETNSSVPIKGVLNQEFGYIEVPLELKYKLNNSQKLGVNLVGGFSTLFLNKNEVSVETSEFSTNLGEANNLNNVNFSGNLGIDIDYKINKNLYLNVAPMLKIQTSTFSKNADNFKPYILGVYSGLNYKF